MTHQPYTMRELAHLVALQSECGRQPDEITAFFITRGWPQVSARRFVNSVLNDLSARRDYDYDDYEEAPRHSFIDWLRGLFVRGE